MAGARRAASGRVSAAAMVVAPALAGCGDDAQVQRCLGTTLAQPVLVLEQAADRSATGLARLGTDGCLVELGGDLALGDDPLLTGADRRVFVLDRQHDTVLEIDPAGPTIVRTRSALGPTETRANRWGVDVDADGRMWIARYDLGSLGLLEADGAWGGVVDLGPVAKTLGDPDGNPEISAVRVVGDEVVAALELLDARDVPYTTTGPSALAIVRRTPPHDVLRTVALTGANPFVGFVPDGGAGAGFVTVATLGDPELAHTDDPGGVERVAVDGSARRLLLTESDVGGSIVEAVVVSDREGYAVVAGPPDANPTWVVAFDPSSPAGPGRVRQVLADSRTGDQPGYVHTGLAVVGSLVLVGDRSPGAARIRVFGRETGTEAGGVAPAAMPPLQILGVER